MQRYARLCRYFGVALLLTMCAALTFPEPASGQLRQQLKNKIVDSVADQMVSEIQTDSCPEFESMLKSRKSGTNSGKAGGMMKKDPAMRERFVNKVAGPLINKMIDCDLLPGR
jgi:hypothetical protein